MAGTVDLPAIGKVKTTYVWVGAAVVVVIVGWAYVRHRNSASASTAAGAGTAAAATAIDPATGYPEGSAEDEAALQAQAGASAYDGVGGGYAGAGSGYSGQQYYYDPADGLYDLTAPYTGSSAAEGATNTGPGTFTNNAYWVQYCEQNVTGYSASQIQGALSAYLAGLGLTSAQMSIYQACIAVGGTPPAPPSTPAHLANTTTGGSSGTGTGTTTAAEVTIPNVVGKTDAQASSQLESAGLRPSITFTAASNKPGIFHIITKTSPAVGSSVAKGTTVVLYYRDSSTS